VLTSDEAIATTTFDETEVGTLSEAITAIVDPTRTTEDDGKVVTS
jgi:hypothetical protein